MTPKLLLRIVTILGLSGCTTLHKNPDVTKWPEAKCAPVAGTKAEACYYRTGENPKFTLFYFHGLLDSVKTIHESIYDHSGMIDMLRKLGSIQIVAISYGKSWLLDDQTTDEIADKIIPQLAIEYKLTKPFRALGHSMGGHNLFTLAVARPKLFDRVALTNPMIVSMDSYDKRTTISAGNYVEGKYNREEWFKRNPFALASKAEKLPKLYLQACRSDKFGLFPDTESLVAVLQARDFDVTLDPQGDGCSHGNFNHIFVVEFLK